MITRPPGNIELAKSLVKQRYGYDIDEIKELCSYDDRNYYIKTTDSKEFLVKISNAFETSLPGFLGKSLTHISVYNVNSVIPV